MSDRDGAVADLAEGRTIEGQAEPQAIIYEALMEALIEWPTDPTTAAKRIAAAAESSDAAPASLLDAAPAGIRMALRADESSAMGDLTERFLHVADRCTGPVVEIQRRGCRALREEPAQAITALAEVATAFERIEYPLPAADTWADAAFLADRLGRTEDVREFVARARALYEACSAIPMLGDVPPGISPAARAATLASASAAPAADD
jgi:hypothetical protein